MSMTAFIGLALAGVLVMLVGLRVMVWWRAQRSTALAKVRHARKRHFDPANFETEWTEADAYVEHAGRIWPYVLGDEERDIKPIWMLLAAILTSSILCAYGFAAAWLISNGVLFALVLLCLVAPLANVVQAHFAIQPRPITGALAAAVVAIAIFNAGYSFIGARVFGNALDTRANITANATNDQFARRERMNAELEAIAQRRATAGSVPVETLRARATAARHEAIRESWRRRAGQSVDEKRVQAGEWGPHAGSTFNERKAEADKLAAQLADAERERALSEEVKTLNSGLDDQTFARTESAPLEVAGYRLGLDWVQILVVTVTTVLDTVLWLWIGADARERRKVWLRKAKEAANLALANQGHEGVRYPLDDEPHVANEATPAQLPAPDGGISLTVEQDPMEVIAASDRLSDIHELFGSSVRLDDDATVTVARLRVAYELRKTNAGTRKYLNRVEFNKALQAYLELRKIKHATGKIVGWRLGVDATPDAEDGAGEPAEEAV